MKKTSLQCISLAFILSTSSIAMAGSATPAPPATPAPAKAPAAAPKAAEPLSGQVLQTMNSGGYSYVNLQKMSGDKVWVAIPETTVKVGDKLAFKGGAEMRNFESKSLKRTFDSIIFSDGILNAAAASTKAPAQEPSPGMPRTTTARESKISIKKAGGADATTIEEAYANSAKLDKKKVVIKGKVVKLAVGIMGRNWIHIQDGTGSQAKGNYDLTCTTSSSLPSVGDVITVSGTLAKDRDFGAGYRYSVIVEDATYKK